MKKKSNPIAAWRTIHNFAVRLSPRCGKSVKFLERDIRAAKRINHISLEEYEWVGYYDMTDAQKATVSTLWTRAELRKRFTNRLYKGVLMNKYIFAKVFSEYYGRKCLTTEALTRTDVDELSGTSGKLVYKPLCKGSGVGVRILSASNTEERDEAFLRIQTLRKGIVEEFLIQHEVLQKLNPNAVSIIRFYSVNTPAGCYLFSPVLTTAVKRNIANGCQDALTALVDIRTGEVITDAVDQNKKQNVDVHPVTGTAFKGLMLPFWDETVELMKKVVPQAYYIANIGWDVALTETGPVLVEANTIPGFNTAQYRGFKEVTNGMLYQPIFDEAMQGIPFTDLADYKKVLIKLN